MPSSTAARPTNSDASMTWKVQNRPAELFQADRLGAPGRVQVEPAGPGADQQVAVPIAVHGADQSGHRRFVAGPRSGQHPVRRQHVVDRAGEPDATAVEQHQVIADGFEVGDHVRGQQHGDPVFGDGGHHRGHEGAARDRVEVGQRLVQHQQRGALGQRQRQRDLGLLAAGQGAGAPAQRDAELFQPPLGGRPVPAEVESASHPQQVGDREAPVQGASRARGVRCRRGVGCWRDR